MDHGWRRLESRRPGGLGASPQHPSKDHTQIRDRFSRSLERPVLEQPMQLLSTQLEFVVRQRHELLL